MDLEEYNYLSQFECDPLLLDAGDLDNKADRTLLYGYTCARETWHVYLEGGIIHTVVYPFEGKPSSVEVTCNNDYIPDKRLYPARCDFEFCALLKGYGEHLPFTTFEEIACEGVYYGEVL